VQFDDFQHVAICESGTNLGAFFIIAHVHISVATTYATEKISVAIMF
jgi:hypothetical protein